MTDAGSVWSNRARVYCGYAGNGNRLVVSNGGWVASLGGVVGLNPGSSNNTALVTGLNSCWTNENELRVGYFDSGNRLMVKAGGQVANYVGYIGSVSTASNNMVVVRGANSLWNNLANVTVGSSSAGYQLVVSNGGAVYSGQYGFIGSGAKSNLARRWSGSARRLET